MVLHQGPEVWGRTELLTDKAENFEVSRGALHHSWPGRPLRGHRVPLYLFFSILPPCVFLLVFIFIFLSLSWLEWLL